MTRLSFKLSNNRIDEEKIHSPKSAETISSSNDQSSSSKILHVVRQALLNAAEELVSQQETLNENSVHTLDMSDNKNDLNESHQRNHNSVKRRKSVKKRETRKIKRIIKNVRRK